MNLRELIERVQQLTPCRNYDEATEYAKAVGALNTFLWNNRHAIAELIEAAEKFQKRADRSCTMYSTVRTEDVTALRAALAKIGGK